MKKRGVVFIREFVPKYAVTLVANKLYKENYRTIRMQHHWALAEDEWFIEYQWKNTRQHSMQILSLNSPQPFIKDSKEEFFTEHYWGYTQWRENETLEYFVDHHPWNLYPTAAYEIDVDFEINYGKGFAFFAV